MALQQFTEFLKEHLVLSFLCCFALYALYSVILSYAKPRVSNFRTGEPIPVVGLPKNYKWFFPKSRARLSSVQNTWVWVSEGYHTYSKEGKTFMIHGIEGDMVLLPPSAIAETKNLPTNVIDIRAAKTLCLPYTFDKYVDEDLFHVGIIKKDLTARLNHMTPLIVEELDLSMKHYISKLASEPDAEGWQSVGIFDLVVKVVARTSHRIFIGEEICREEGFLEAAVSYAVGVIPTALALNCLPTFSWPIVGPIITYPLSVLRRRVRKHLEPIIKKRLADIRSEFPESERPNDFLQWTLEASIARGGGYLSMDAISNRMLTVAFAAIHTTSLSGTNAFYDLAYNAHQTPAGEKNAMDVIREELMTVFPPPHEFNKRYMQQLYNLDAFLKETGRLGLSGAIHSDRIVTTPSGITTSNGIFLPKGTAFSFPQHAKITDEDIYENATEHKYTRFYRGDLGPVNKETSDSNREETTDEKGTSDRKLDRYMVTITDDYPIFGIGLHACPGRFFAANELRILVAWLLLRYEIKPIEKKPEGFKFTYNAIVDSKAHLQIRKRKGVAE
ncbi:hypothetical protein ABW19_dt0207875 [Dactylella cylindrospora]|nr:hypothetical protein ABW19_dt0207875 [Dactylella cylindrospora]